VYASATVRELKSTGDANVRYFSNGDLLAERSTFGASLISKLACIPHVQELWACPVSQGETWQKGPIGDRRMTRRELTKKSTYT
jgi:hypothetical protein